MDLRRPGALAALCVLLVSSIASAQYCPDYDAVVAAPELRDAPRTRFRRWQSSVLSATARPWHMVHDRLVQNGESTTVVGKFDYGTVTHKDLELEYVNAYLWGTGTIAWQWLGRHQTDRDGKVSVPVPALPNGDYEIRMVVEGDGSVATGYVSVVDPGQPTIVFDIDGTLTTDDLEAVGDYLGITSARARAGAADAVWSYVRLGYRVVFVTARQYWQARSTREWLEEQGLFAWQLRTNPYGELLPPADQVAYKTEVLRELAEDVRIVRAYGNSSTDLDAYRDASIPRAVTYFAGPQGGEDGTIAIGDDYLAHNASVIASTAATGCTWR